VIAPGPFAAADRWKFGYGYSVTLALVLLACTVRAVRRRFVRSGILAFAGLVNLLHDYRSLAGVCILAAVYSASTDLRGGAQPPVRARFYVRRAVVVGALLGGIGLSFVALYGHLASSGALGASAAQKYEAQAGSPLGLLKNGRPEILVSSRAVADSPLLGHGSWARDPKYLQMQLGDGAHPSASTLAQGLIPTHSFLMGAWVEAGLLGVSLWVWALFLAVGVLARQYLRNGQLVALTVFAAIALVWDVLFSPYGSFERLIAPYYVLVLVAARRSLASHSREVLE
jgi:hypothetical protein